MRFLETRQLGDVARKYDYTSKLGADRWAWEFCRRDPELRDKARFYSSGDHISERPAPCPGLTLLKLRRPIPEAEAYGLCFFPDPDNHAVDADLFWSAEQYPRDISVHVVDAVPGEIDEYQMLALQRCRITHLTSHDGSEQFILRGARCAIQIMAHGMSLLSPRPHKMVVTIGGGECPDTKADVLKKARRVYDACNIGPPQWTRAGRGLRDALICLDAKEAGLSYWEMAEIIFGYEHVEANRSRGSRALKDVMRRNLQRGETLRDGGYRELLQPKVKGSLLSA